MARMMSVAQVRGIKLDPPFVHFRYRAEVELNTGRFAQGFQGIITRLAPGPDNMVAIKVFQVDNPVTPAEAMKEAEIMKRLDHQNVIKFLDLATAAKTKKLLLVMEFADGGSLHEALEIMKRPTTNMELGKWTHEFASGVGYLHSKGVIHRDLSPSSIFLKQAKPPIATEHPNYWLSHTIKIGDFGSSKLLEGKTSKTKTYIEGDVAFMAPELLTKCRDHLGVGKAYDAAVDIWSMGADLFQMATGRKMLHQWRNAAKNQRQAHELLKDIEQIQLRESRPPSSSIPETFWRLILNAVAADVKKRPKPEDFVKSVFVKSNYKLAIAALAEPKATCPQTAAATASRARDAQMTPATRPKQAGKAMPATAPAASDRITTRSMAKAQLAAGKKP